MEGDEEVGRELVEDRWINIGVTIGTFALRTIAKPIISKVLKNKLVREFGQEFVDKLLKNSDDIPTAGRAIKKLRKLNVGDDVIRELGERFGQKGYDWLLNRASLNLSDDIIKKLMHTDDFLTYSDDLLRAIQKSNGYADDIIRQVKKYGDDAAQAIAKYGDDAVDSLKEGKTPDEVRAARGNNNLKLKELMDDLANSGVKYNAEAVIMVTRMTDGSLVWLEEGNSTSGLTHILERHSNDFESQGVEDIPQLLKDVLETAPVNKGNSDKGLFADFILGENMYRVAYGTNGYIVSFYPID